MRLTKKLAQKLPQKIPKKNLQKSQPKKFYKKKIHKNPQKHNKNLQSKTYPLPLKKIPLSNAQDYELLKNET